MDGEGGEMQREGVWVRIWDKNIDFGVLFLIFILCCPLT